MYNQLGSLIQGTTTFSEVNCPTENHILDDITRFPRPSAFCESEYNPQSVYGETSLFNNVSISRSRDDTSELRQLNRDTDVLESIKLFFNWLYPDLHFFIYREAFLVDFFHPSASSSYCSKELVLAVCAIGSSISDNPQLAKMSSIYYKLAKDSLIQQLDRPLLVNLQAFLLLGMFDIYNGRNNIGWMMLGIGFRMGLAIGFQVDPSSITGSSSSLAASIRSRVFWGAYLLDHFISIFLGRPSQLKIEISSTPASDAMPDIEWIGEYSLPDCLLTRGDIVKPLNCLVSLATIADDVIINMFNQKMKDTSLSKKLNLLDSYNKVLIDWKESLHEEMQWDIEKLKTMGKKDFIKFVVTYYYYTVVLCINRPFLHLKQGTDTAMYPSTISRNSVEHLHTCIMAFTEFHNAIKCSVLASIGCITSVSALLLLNSSKTKLALPKKETRMMLDFIEFLQSSAKRWQLSARAASIILMKLKDKYNFHYSKEQQLHSEQNTDKDSASEQSSTANDQEDIDGEPTHDSLLDDVFESLNEETFGGPPLFLSLQTLLNDDIAERGPGSTQTHSDTM